MGAEIVAIAVTPTFAQMAFADRLGIDFPLLSDWDGEVSEAYGVRYDIWKGHAGLAKRSVFVVGGDGSITYRWYTDDAHDIPDVDEVISALREAAGEY
jgi:glutaredoxin-dependent peroxiredoxin